MYLIIIEVTPDGLRGTLNMETNNVLKRQYGMHIKKLDGVYFAPWESVERIYMES
ncbi:hypothetical protein [Paenibacillus agricola]|uniref:hypothetical protein n=1 Tax=Paenibacillus agricola TaxID=2716264 RepID=UPI001A9F9451|nr:hypothetical protein [Paenibacillus agricola]